MSCTQYWIRLRRGKSDTVDSDLFSAYSFNYPFEVYT